MQIWQLAKKKMRNRLPPRLSSMLMERVDDNMMRQLANGTHESIEQPKWRGRGGSPRGISVNSQCTANIYRNSRNAVVVVVVVVIREAERESGIAVTCDDFDIPPGWRCISDFVLN